MEQQQNQQGSSSCIPNKRKRGRPRRDESQTQQQVRDENLIGQVVSGVVEGSFEAGYFLNVKVADTEKQLKGVVFLPNKVTPITPTTDLFPRAKMYAREDISLNQQPPPPQGSRTHDLSVCSEAINERNLGSAEPQGQTLSLMPQFSNDDVSKEDDTVLRSEATTTTTLLKDSTVEGSATLVDFFPTPETAPKQATLSLELFQNETKPSGIEEEKKSPADDVPEELQLELGNKNTSGSAIAAEAKSGFSTNLFEGRVEGDAASESGFPEATQVDGKDS